MGAVGEVVEFVKDAKTTIGAAAQVIDKSKPISAISTVNKATSAVRTAEAAYNGNAADAVGEAIKTFSSGTGKAMTFLDAVPVVGELAQVPGHILASMAYGAGATIQAANAAVHGDFKEASTRVVGGVAGATVKLIPFSEIADTAVTVHGMATGGSTNSLADRADKKSVRRWAKNPCRPKRLLPEGMMLPLPQLSQTKRLQLMTRISRSINAHNIDTRSC